MNRSLQSRFFELLNRFRKLKFQSQMDLSHGEFMMMGAIYYGTIKKRETEETNQEAIDCEKKLFCSEKKEQPNGVGISELIKTLKGSKSATSKMLRNLEEKHFIIRELDTKDKRNVTVRLTEEGERTLLEARRQMEEFTALIIERMGEEDANKLLQLMGKLYEIVEEENKKKKEEETKEDS